MTNRQGSHIYLILSLSHTHTFHMQAQVRSLHLSKAPPNYELLHTIMSTMRGPWPHKSTHNQPQALPHSHYCPTLHTHTCTDTQRPLQSQGSHYAIPAHKDKHQSLSRQRREKSDRDGGRKIGWRWRKVGETRTTKSVWLGCGGTQQASYY